MSKYQTIKDVLTRVELDQRITVVLRSGQYISGEMLEWAWDGDIVCIKQDNKLHEIRIDAIDVVTRYL